MNKDYEEIQEILIDLTRAFGYDEKFGNAYPESKHKIAFDIAFNRLCKLIDKINNAERC